jgi:hypothetical protein
LPHRQCFDKFYQDGRWYDRRSNRAEHVHGVIIHSNWQFCSPKMKAAPVLVGSVNPSARPVACGQDLEESIEFTDFYVAEFGVL